MANEQLIFKPQNKYKVIRFLDDNCIDYESYDSSNSFIVTINESITDSMLEQLEDIDVG